MTIQQPYYGKIKDIKALGTGEGDSISKRVVFGPGKFWEDHVMRVFTVKPGAASPFHSHDWPHYVIFLQGKASGNIDGVKVDLEKGDFAYVPSNVEHNFTNSGSEDLTFICIVPTRGDDYFYPGSEE
ncbi:MAG: cupin domain-containing protein [Synergistales bacterium]|nr:cupin domain-containing protein [Synergistales bacterium]